MQAGEYIDQLSN